MHILLTAVSASSSPSGVCRHAANLARGLAEHPAIKQLTLVTSSWQEPYFSNTFQLAETGIHLETISVRNHPLYRNAWYLLGLPKLARTLRPDIIHLSFPVPFIRGAFSVPIVLTLHDLFPFDLPGNFATRAPGLYRAVLRKALRDANAIVCVSEFTKRSIERHQLRVTHDVCTIPNAIAHVDTNHLPIRDPLVRRPFLLSVAQHRANKNLLLALEAFEKALSIGLLEPHTNYLIVGDYGPETNNLKRYVDDHCMQTRIRFLRNVTDEELAELYRSCLLLLAPSQIEGFGLPVAECLSNGCRAVCSDIEAFREIATSDAVFFQLSDGVNGLVEAIRSALTSSPIAPKSKFFSVKEVADRHVQVYRHLLHDQSELAWISKDLPAGRTL